MNSESHFAAQQRIAKTYRRGLLHGMLAINVLWIVIGFAFGVFR